MRCRLIAGSPAHFFEVADAVRVRGGGRGGRGGAGPATPQYAPVGAYFDYWFAERPAGEVTLEIFDTDGNLVRGLSSQASGISFQVPDELSMREWRLERVGTPRLQADAGMHRDRKPGRSPSVQPAVAHLQQLQILNIVINHQNCSRFAVF